LLVEEAMPIKRVDMRVIVISDLHMGAGPLEDFDPEVEAGLVEFCAQIAADDRPTEFVINGDFCRLSCAGRSRPAHRAPAADSW
jgi:hypothetical protein